MTDPKTKVMMIPGLSCALCGTREGPGLHFPVFAADGQPAMPRVCQPCLAVILGVALQLAGHAGAQVAAIVVSLGSTGQPT